MSPQLPLTLKFPTDQRLDAYVGRDDVRDLVASVAAGLRSDWLYLAGPAGSGKTHLLLAACAHAQSLGRRAAYLPMPALSGQMEPALAGLEEGDLVCLDGIDAVAGHRVDEIALFHFHNRARATQVRLIYAAWVMPVALALVVPDLGSRLEQCTRLALEPLDESARRDVLRQRAARRGLELDEPVLDYLFRRVGRDLATLTQLLDQLDRESLAAQRRITVPFLRGVLDAGKTR